MAPLQASGGTGGPRVSEPTARTETLHRLGTISGITPISVMYLSWVGRSRLSYPLKLLQAFPGFFKKLLVQLVLLFNLLLKVTDHLTVPVIIDEAGGPERSGVVLTCPFLLLV